MKRKGAATAACISTVSVPETPRIEKHHLPAVLMIGNSPLRASSLNKVAGGGGVEEQMFTSGSTRADVVQ